MATASHFLKLPQELVDEVVGYLVQILNGEELRREYNRKRTWDDYRAHIRKTAAYATVHRVLRPGIERRLFDAIHIGSGQRVAALADICKSNPRILRVIKSMVVTPITFQPVFFEFMESLRTAAPGRVLPMTILPASEPVNLFEPDDTRLDGYRAQLDIVHSLRIELQGVPPFVLTLFTGVKELMLSCVTFTPDTRNWAYSYPNLSRLVIIRSKGIPGGFFASCVNLDKLEIEGYCDLQAGAQVNRRPKIRCLGINLVRFALFMRLAADVVDLSRVKYCKDMNERNLKTDRDDIRWSKEQYRCIQLVLRSSKNLEMLLLNRLLIRCASESAHVPFDIPGDTRLKTVEFHHLASYEPRFRIPLFVTRVVNVLCRTWNCSQAPHEKGLVVHVKDKILGP